MIVYSSLFYSKFDCLCTVYISTMFLFLACTHLSRVSCVCASTAGGYFIYGQCKACFFLVLFRLIQIHSCCRSFSWLSRIFAFSNFSDQHSPVNLWAISLSPPNPLCCALLFTLDRFVLCARLLQFMRMDFTCLLYFSVAHQFQNANTIFNCTARLSTLSISFSDSLLYLYVYVCALETRRRVGVPLYLSAETTILSSLSQRTHTLSAFRTHFVIYLI